MPINRILRKHRQGRTLILVGLVVGIICWFFYALGWGASAWPITLGVAALCFIVYGVSIYVAPIPHRRSRIFWIASIPIAAGVGAAFYFVQASIFGTASLTILTICILIPLIFVGIRILQGRRRRRLFR